MQRGFRAARAAALLLIASGAGGAASVYLPQLDERWIFVAAAALIAAIDGVWLGVAAAIAAPFADELVVRSAFTFVPERDGLTLAAALGAAVLIGVARAVFRRPPRLRETQHRVLLPHAETIEVQPDYRHRVEELEARLADAHARSGAASTAQIARIAELEADLSDTRMRLAHVEKRFAKSETHVEELEADVSRRDALMAQLEDEVAKRATRIAELERDAAAARQENESQRTRATDLESQLAEVRSNFETHRERITELEQDHAAARQENDAHRGRIAELESQLAHTRTSAEESLDVHRTRLAEYERDHDAQRTRIGELESRLGEGAMHVEQFERSVAQRDAKIAEVEQALEDARAHHRRASAENDAAQRRIVESESQNVDLQQAIEKSQARIAELESGLADAVASIDQKDAALEAARATSESLAARIAELEDAIENAREKLEAEFSEKLNTIVTHLASDHEVDLGEALTEREAARAEVRDLTSRMAELKRMLDEKSTPPEHGFTVVNLGEPKKHSVLLIHRDAMLRTTAKRALERNGYKVTTAADGLEALRIAMTERPDVVLADTQMPKMDGRALVQLLKSRSETASMKIVLIGATDVKTDNGSEFRADDFILDPLNIEALKATIENVLVS